MAANARFSVADVVLVPFPFTDQSGTKKRPAVVVSSAGYNLNRRDIVIMAITSQVRQPLAFGEAMIADWQAAGLIKASVLKPVFTTIEQGLVIRTMGALSPANAKTLHEVLGDVDRVSCGKRGLQELNPCFHGGRASNENDHGRHWVLDFSA